MTEEKQTWKQLIPYAGIPVFGIVLWFLHQETEPAALLIQEVLLVFGYLAAVGDFRRKRVPNELIGAMLGAWILLIVPQLFYRTDYALWLLVSGGVGFLLAGAIFLIVYLVSRRGLGGGDVKLMAVTGLYLGADVLPAMLYGSVLAAVTGIGLLLAKKIGRRDTVPLVPFLYAGILLTLFSQS